MVTVSSLTNVVLAWLAKAKVLSFATPLVALWAIFVGALMVSRIPTFSLKYLKLPSRMAVPVMALLALVVAALIHAPWVTLFALSAGYLVSIPLSLRHYRRQEKKFLNENEDIASLAFGISATGAEQNETGHVE